MSDSRTHTPTPWAWHSEDNSMLILCERGDPLGRHILAVAPCKACLERSQSEEWVWGLCMTPEKVDATHILACVNSHDGLVEALRFYADAKNWEEPSHYESRVYDDDGDIARRALEAAGITEAGR